MKKQQWLAGPLVLACSLGLAGVTVAQPGGNNGGNRPDFQNMTPEQRQQFFAQAQERRLREQLTQAGFTEAAIQDPIVAFSKALETVRTPLRDKSNKLRDAVANKTADAEVATMIKDLRTSTETAKKQRDDALKDLDAKVGYSQKPRLEAFLIAGGYISDEVSFANGVGGGRGGFGGQGGGQGGGGGRGGGRGGNNN